MAELLLQEAADQKDYNCEFAQVNLAKLLLDRPDYFSKQKGLEYAEEASRKNYPQAFEMLCRIYEFGWWNVPNIRDRGLYYAQKGAALGNAFCEAALSIRYTDGKGVSRDYNEAFRLAKSAADKNESLGCYMCGFLYENVIHNDQKALEYYEKAVRLGDDASRPLVERIKKKLDQKDSDNA